jgi:excisionase family DNA binding protein
MDVPISVSELAERLGRSPRTIRRWIAAGYIDAVRPNPAGAFLIPAAEAERLLGDPRTTRALDAMTDLTTRGENDR